MQADILEAGSVTNLMTKIHMFCSAVFFFCAFGHGTVVVCWQADYCRQRRRHALAASFYVKASIMFAAVLTIVGPLPEALLNLCSKQRCGDDGSMLRQQNLVGLAQRLMVCCICCFLGSYSLDIHDMRKQRANECDDRPNFGSCDVPVPAATSTSGGGEGGSIADAL